ncbi:unnamed protein product [Amoebophrya sp. A120]|nr:unnamed protein product [Amoebophrya sp. A120]|eukprot:GSA120T00005955001.1
MRGASQQDELFVSTMWQEVDRKFGVEATARLLLPRSAARRELALDEDSMETSAIVGIVLCTVIALLLSRLIYKLDSWMDLDPTVLEEEVEIYSLQGGESPDAGVGDPSATGGSTPAATADPSSSAGLSAASGPARRPSAGGILSGTLSSALGVGKRSSTSRRRQEVSKIEQKRHAGEGTPLPNESRRAYGVKKAKNTYMWREFQRARLLRMVVKRAGEATPETSDPENHLVVGNNGSGKGDGDVAGARGTAQTNASLAATETEHRLTMWKRLKSMARSVPTPRDQAEPSKPSANNEQMDQSKAAHGLSEAGSAAPLAVIPDGNDET